MNHKENKILELERNLIFKKYTQKGGNDIFFIDKIKPNGDSIIIYLSPYLDKNGNQTECEYEMFKKLYAEV